MRTAHPAQTAGQRQFAREFEAVQPRCIERTGGDQDAERDRQIESALIPSADRPAQD
jgi:hypothetical protein